MRRLFISDEEVRGDRLLLGGTRLHYLCNVLRMGPGDSFIAVRANATQQLATLIGVGDKELTASLSAPEPVNTEPRVELTLFQAIIKGKAMTLAIQKCVELGVTAIAPLFTERTVVRIKDADRTKKQRRWQQIAEEAARQSERVRVPEVLAAVDFEQALFSLNAGPALLFAERHVAASSMSVGEALAGHKDAERVAVFVGPEGGFNNHEIDLAAEHGLTPITLGPRVLRAETAAIVACALVLYELGDMQ